MKRAFQFAIGLLWLAPVVMYMQYRMVWDRLPQNVATHFGANGQPNGWMSRETASTYPLLFVVPLLLAVTIALLRVGQPEIGSWAILVLFYLVFGALITITHQIIAFNIGGQPIQVVPVIGLIFVGVLLFLFVFLGAKRGAKLPHSEVVAEEIHGPGTLSFVLCLPVVIGVIMAFSIPDSAARTILELTALIFVPVIAFMWAGFHYRFTHAGVEIRTLGLRLRSIPKEHIREYRQDSWSLLGGYGIRGIGRDRAYVWCNSGVRIRTDGGSVFLGHTEPQRLIHDLDVLTKAAH